MTLNESHSDLQGLKIPIKMNFSPINTLHQILKMFCKIFFFFKTSAFYIFSFI